MDITKTAGKEVLRLRPDKTYTRHSEGAFLRLKDGSILYAWSRFTGSFADSAPSDIVGCRSYDEGETWGETKTLLRAKDFGTHNIMSVSLMRMENGDLGLFFGSRAKPNVSLHHLARSADDGETFYTSLVYSNSSRPGYYVLNNDRVIRTRSGRLIAPLACHRGGYNYDHADEGESAQKWSLDYAAYDTFLYSDDDGRTWQESADTVHPPFVSGNGLQEPGIIEKENGVLWAWARTDHCYQYEMFSFDGGNHWTQAQPSRFTSACSPMQIRRNPADGSLISVWNPIPNYNGRLEAGTSPFGGRTPLVYAVSRDDGLTWTEPVVIEGREDAGYCYPCVFFTKDSSMLVGYCAGLPEDGDMLAACTVRKIAL